MKRKLWMTLLALCLVVPLAQAGLFKNSVDLADLSETSPEALETLKDTEFAVFVARVRLNTAKADERRAGGGVKAADRTLEAENLDLKAAKAELKAAKANVDENRSTAAAAQIAGAEEDLETSRALRKWKEQEREAQEARVAMAKSALDLAEARRDLARVSLLKSESAPSAEKYDIDEFEKSVAKRQKEYDSANGKAIEKTARVDKAKAAWDRIAKNVELVGEE